MPDTSTLTPVARTGRILASLQLGFDGLTIDMCREWVPSIVIELERRLPDDPANDTLRLALSDLISAFVVAGESKNALAFAFALDTLRDSLGEARVAVALLQSDEDARLAAWDAEFRWCGPLGVLPSIGGTR